MREIKFRGKVLEKEQNGTELDWVYKFTLLGITIFNYTETKV